MNNPKIIFLMGLPGAGKGTQAEILCAHFGWYHFETSKMIREKFASSPNDPVVIEGKKAYASGQLVETKVSTNWLIERINNMQLVGGIVFDGSPRTYYEVQTILPFLIEKFGRENILSVDIKVSNEDTMWRNTHRRICKKCGQSIPFFPDTEKLTECQKCGGELVTRDLDQPEIIKERIEAFIKDTAPVIEYLKKENLMKEVDGKQSIENVSEQIKKSVIEYFKL